MKRRLNGFVWIGLGIALLLALFLSPFAFTSPDGLEKVAETKGFSEKGESLKFWKYAPLPDYAIPWIKNEKISTALSGLIGTLAIFFIALGIGRLIKNNRSKKALLLISPPFFISLTLALALTLTSTSIYAARPLSTDDAGTVEKGKFQLEMGFDATRQGNHNREYSPSLPLTYDFLERMDLGIGSGYLFVHPKEGTTRRTRFTHQKSNCGVRIGDCGIYINDKKLVRSFLMHGAWSRGHSHIGY